MPVAGVVAAAARATAQASAAAAAAAGHLPTRWHAPLSPLPRSAVVRMEMKTYLMSFLAQ
jgi:hypothetical protein